MIVAGIQHDIVWEQPAENFVRLAPMIERAAAAGARLVVLTEMYATGFSMKTDRIAEPIGGPSACFLVDQARAHSVWVCASVPERAEPTARTNTFWCPRHRFMYESQWPSGEMPPHCIAGAS